MPEQNHSPRNALIWKLHLDGLTCSDIADRMGLTYPVVYGVIRRADDVSKSIDRGGDLLSIAPEPESEPDWDDDVIGSGQCERAAITQEDENHQTAESKSVRIRTLEQLLEACEVDLSVWQVDHWIANKWEVGAKDKETGEIVVSPLWQVKAWLRRTEPVKIEFTLEPVQINTSPVGISSGKRDGVRKVLLWTDPHFGFSIDGRRMINYHDRRALSVFAQIMQAEGIQSSVCLGDLIDAAEWSDKFVKSREFYFTTQPALIEAAWWLEALRTSDILEGNHDARVKIAQLNRLMYAYGLKSVDDLDGYPALSIPALLNLDKRSINWVEGYPDAELWLNEGICLTHGDKASNVPGGTAGAYLRDGKAHSTVAGHAHRQETAGRMVRTHGRNAVIQAHIIGCACRLDGVVPGSNKRSNWHQSCAVVEYDDEGWYNLIPVPVIDGQAYYNGRRYTGDDGIIEQIKADTGMDV